MEVRNEKWEVRSSPKNQTRYLNLIHNLKSEIKTRT